MTETPAYRLRHAVTRFLRRAARVVDPVDYQAIRAQAQADHDAMMAEVRARAAREAELEADRCRIIAGSPSPAACCSCAPSLLPASYGDRPLLCAWHLPAWSVRSWGWA
jgi:hypothetical protein